MECALLRATSESGCAPWDHLHLLPDLELCTGDHVQKFQLALSHAQSNSNGSMNCPQCTEDCESLEFDTKVGQMS